MNFGGCRSSKHVPAGPPYASTSPVATATSVHLRLTFFQFPDQLVGGNETPYRPRTHALLHHVLSISYLISSKQQEPLPVGRSMGASRCISLRVTLNDCSIWSAVRLSGDTEVQENEQSSRPKI